MVEAIGTIKVNRTGDAVSNVASPSNNLVNRGKLFCYPPPHKPLDNTRYGRTSLIDFEIVDGEFVIVRTPYRQSQKKLEKVSEGYV